LSVPSWRAHQARTDESSVGKFPYRVRLGGSGQRSTAAVRWGACLAAEQLRMCSGRFHRSSRTEKRAAAVV